jgi:hypothetical protein
MLRRFLSNRVVIVIVLSLQVAPLLVFPPSSYSLRSQEWWLPVLLSFLVILSLIQILVRKSRAPWPWYLFSFAQGLNIISRLMMLMPHATVTVGKVQQFNLLYVVLALAAILFSVFELWYCDLPEVRSRLAA